MNTKLTTSKVISRSTHQVVAHFTNGFAQNVIELDDGTVPNDKLTYATYLDRIADRIEVISFGKRATGKTIARRDPSKVYVVSMAHHMACVKEGKVRDTWNSSDKAAYIVWELR